MVGFTAVFKNHRFAADACNDLSGIGCYVINGPKRRGKEELIVNFPPATPKKTRRLERVARRITVKKYDGKLVLW